MKQSLFISKENSAPTVSSKSLKISCVIYAMENCDIAIVDTPGALMQADMEGTV